MAFLQQIIVGLRGYSQALRFLSKHRLFHLLVWPALLNMVAFFFIGWLAWVYSGHWIAYLGSFYEMEGDWVFLKGLLQFIVAMAIRLVVILLFLRFFKYWVLIVYAPILTLISEKIQALDTGISKPFRLGQFAKEVYRAIGVVLVNLVLEWGLTVALLLVALLLPPLMVVVPAAVFLVESFFYGFAMMDYRSDFHGLTATESRNQIWQYKGVALANGLVFHLALLVPVLGVLLAPPLAVVAAGLSYNKVLASPIS